MSSALDLVHSVHQCIWSLESPGFLIIIIPPPPLHYWLIPVDYSHTREARLPLVFLFPCGEGVLSLLWSQPVLQRPAGRYKDPPTPRPS